MQAAKAAPSCKQKGGAGWLLEGVGRAPAGHEALLGCKYQHQPQCCSIRAPEVFSQLTNLDTLSPSHQAEVVAADERETNDLRATLNLGHTFGHAIETQAGYGKWLHGEAVAAGTCMAADLSHRLVSNKPGRSIAGAGRGKRVRLWGAGPCLVQFRRTCPSQTSKTLSTNGLTCPPLGPALITRLPPLLRSGLD